MWRWALVISVCCWTAPAAVKVPTAIQSRSRRGPSGVAGAFGNPGQQGQPGQQDVGADALLLAIGIDRVQVDDRLEGRLVRLR
jgi:hypothetical protein